MFISFSFFYINFFIFTKISKEEVYKMKSTGITRHIDELGRIVIPKEIRMNLNIEVNDLLEFYIEDSKLILEKSSRIKKIDDVMNQYINVFFQNSKKSIVVCDKDKIIGISKDLKRNLLKQVLSDENKKILFSNSIQGSISLEQQEFFYIKKSLILDGMVTGQVLFLNDTDNFSDMDKNDLLLLTNLFISYLRD